MQELNGLPRIPSAWGWSTISDACLKVQDGTHFSPQNQLAQGAYRYITAKNVRPSGLDLSNVSYLAEDEHRTIYKRCDPKKGDVLLVKDGVNTGDAAVNTLDEEFSLLSSVCLLRPRPELLFSQFLRYYLLSPVGYRMLTGQMTGTAIKRIILGRIKESPVPIAPLDEQRTIVAEIEKQFSRLDEAVANLKRVKAHLKRYKASVLKAAVEGKLTEDWRNQHLNVEAASKLLERILAERRAKWSGKGKYKEPTAPDTSDLPDLPNRWCWATMPQLGELNRGKSKHRPRNDSKLFGGPYPFIQTGDVKHSGGFVRSHSQTYNESGLAQSRLWSAGTLCITIAANIAETGILTYPACFPDSVVGFVFDGSPATIRYIDLFFRTEREEIARFAPATAQKNINLEILSEVAVPFPPLEELNEIVAEVERRLSVIEELEAAVQANLTRADRLRQSILSQAFSVRLPMAKQ